MGERDALADGNVSDVVRVGNMVRRMPGRWSTALAAWAAAGVPAYVKLWREGHGDGAHGNLAYLRHHRAEIERHLT